MAHFFKKNKRYKKQPFFKKKKDTKNSHFFKKNQKIQQTKQPWSTLAEGDEQQSRPCGKST